MSKSIKREVSKYKRDIAEWEVIRSKGLARFVFLRGILRHGLPVGIVGAILYYLFDWAKVKYGIEFESVLLTRLFYFACIFVIAAYVGIRSGYKEWRRCEKEYESWKNYEKGGSILGL